MLDVPTCPGTDRPPALPRSTDPLVCSKPPGTPRIGPGRRGPRTVEVPFPLVTFSRSGKVRARTRHLIPCSLLGAVRSGTGYLVHSSPFPVWAKSARGPVTSPPGYLFPFGRSPRANWLPWSLVAFSPLDEVRARTAHLFPWSLKSQGDFGRTLDESRQGREGGWLRCERSRSSR